MSAFQLLSFPMRKRDWTPEDIEQIADLLRDGYGELTIARAVPGATWNDILEIRNVLNIRSNAKKRTKRA